MSNRDNRRNGKAVRSNPHREFLRHTIRVPLEVTRADGVEPLMEEGVNVGYGGLAFVSTRCPKAGEILQLRIATVEPAFEAAARVAWCRPEDDRYLVGVEFLDSSDAFRSRMVQQVCSIENYRQEIEEQEGRALDTSEAASEWITKYAGRFPDSETVYPEDFT